MALTITSRYSYPTTQQLYNCFDPIVLRNRIKAEQDPPIPLSDTTHDTVIDNLLETLVVPLNFGKIDIVSHAYLNGQPSSSTGYPPKGGEIDLKGFKIGEPNTRGAIKRRVVISAGAHARELAPSLALCEFFSQLIVNYVRSIVFFKYGGVNMIHPGFSYSAGKRVAMQKNGVALGENDSPINEAEIMQMDMSYEETSAFMQSLEIIIIPVANPGGRDFVLTMPGNESDIEKEARFFWRKNRSPLGLTGTDADKQQAIEPPKRGLEMIPIGVDIERNANIAWDPSLYYESNTDALRLHSGGLNYNRFIDYSGPRAESELETKAVRDAIQYSFDDKDEDGNNKLPPFSSADPNDLPAKYNGTVCFLNLHSFSTYVYIPWGMDVNSSNSQAWNQSQLNPSAAANSVKSDGVYKIDIELLAKANLDNVGIDNIAGTGDRYQEYFPATIKFGSANSKPCELYTIHRKIFAEKIVTYIKKCVGGLTKNSKDPQHSSKMEKRSTYGVSQGLEWYTSTGTLTDWAFSLNLKGFDSITAANIGRNGPVIALTVEVGSPEDGGYTPIDEVVANNRVVKKQNQYKKVERETFAAIFAFLKSSLEFRS